eukprot:12904214-Prorocentrum_lima.AAC.1
MAARVVEPLVRPHTKLPQRPPHVPLLSHQAEQVEGRDLSSGPAHPVAANAPCPTGPPHP